MVGVKNFIREEKSFLGLLLLGILFNILKVNFILGISFSFSSIFFLIITKKYGVKKGLIAVLLAQGLTSIVLFEFKFEVLKVFEVVVVGWVLSKKKTTHMILIDIAYWTGAMIFVSFFHIMMFSREIHQSFFFFQVFKNVVNSLFNAEIADVVIVYLPLRNILKKREYSISFKDLIFHIIVLMVMVPFMLNASIGIISQYHSIVKTNMKITNNTKNSIEEYLSTWDEKKVDRLLLNSRVERGELRNKILSLNGENVFNITVMDKYNNMSVTDVGQGIDIREYKDAYSFKEIDENIYEVVFDRNFKKGEIAYEYKILKNELKLYIKIPIEYIRDDLIKNMQNQLILLFSLIVLSSSGAMIINSFFSKSIDRLIDVTGSTQDILNKKKNLKPLKSYVEEVNVLEKNYGDMLYKLIDSFDELEESKKDFEKLAYTDFLTGIPNRLAFSRVLEEKVLTCIEGAVGLMLIDINKFKNVNDTLGHAAGDMLLIEVTKRLKELEKSNVSIFRQGGDELAVIITGHSTESIINEAYKISDIFKMPYRILDEKFIVTGSMGVSIYPKDTKNIEELMRFADIAMYEGKTKKRKRPIIYSEMV